MESERARAAIEVTAGLIPGGTPDSTLTRRWVITSAEWEAAKNGNTSQGELLATVQGKAQGYAALLMLQPDRLNWVRTDWIWF